MASKGLRNDERLGLCAAIVLHGVVLAAIMYTPKRDQLVQEPERIEVTIADAVGETSTSPNPDSEAAADTGPEVGDAAAESAPADAGEPAPEPAPIPVVQPKPEPKPAPKPAPQPEPKPQPKSLPQPVPKPEPKPEPKPAPKPVPAPRPSPSVRPRPQETPKPAPKPSPAPKPTPKSTPTTAPSARPSARPTAQPSARPTARATQSNSSDATRSKSPIDALVSGSRGSADTKTGSAGRATSTATTRSNTAGTASTPPKKAGSSAFDDAFKSGTPGGTAARSTGAPAAQIGAREQSALGAAITRQLRPHWQAPQGADVELLVTRVRFRLNPNGSLAGEPTVVSTTGQNAANQAQVQRHQEQAIRAVKLAAPFNLPDDLYEGWKVVTTSFDRRLSQ